MQIRIVANSATAEQLREIALALSSCGLEGPRVYAEGPEHWTLETPKMRPSQFAQVVGRVVKVDGRPVADVVELELQQAEQAREDAEAQLAEAREALEFVEACGVILARSRNPLHEIRERHAALGADTTTEPNP